MKKIDLRSAHKGDKFMTENGCIGLLMTESPTADGYALGMTVKKNGHARFRLGIYDKEGKDLRDGNEGFNLAKEVEDED